MARIKKIGIYLITSPTGRKYVGQSIDIQKRFTNYKSLNNCITQRRLYRSFLKHGTDNHQFEIIIECDISKLNDLERYWQEYYDVCHRDKGMNCMLTKSSTRSGRSSQETKDKIAISSRRKRKPRSEETKEKLRQANLGKKHSKESKEKQSAIHIGNKYNLGRKHTDEAKRKMSEFRKGNKYSLGVKHSEQAKINMAESKLFRNIILDTQTGIYYYDYKSASDSIRMDNSHFIKVMKGRYKNKTSMILV